MISSLHGQVLSSGPNWVDLAVQGVGFRVQVTGSAANGLAQKVGTDASLHCSLVVREDALTLYGFEAQGDRDTFEILMTVKGVGPKLAMAALDAIGSTDLARAVATDDLTTLQRIPGVGKKTAQRLVLEIGDRLGPVPEGRTASTTASSSDPAAEAVATALEQLGWPRAVATRAIASIEDHSGDTESMLRAALSYLGGGRGL